MLESSLVKTYKKYEKIKFENYNTEFIKNSHQKCTLRL